MSGLSSFQSWLNGVKPGEGRRWQTHTDIFWRKIHQEVNNSRSKCQSERQNIFMKAQQNQQEGSHAVHRDETTIIKSVISDPMSLIDGYCEIRLKRVLLTSHNHCWSSVISSALEGLIAVNYSGFPGVFALCMRSGVLVLFTVYTIGFIIIILNYLLFLCVQFS